MMTHSAKETRQQKERKGVQRLKRNKKRVKNCSKVSGKTIEGKQNQILLFLLNDFEQIVTQ